MRNVSACFQLAASLEPVEVRPGAAICMLTAALTCRDNKYLLKVSDFRVFFGEKKMHAVL